MARRLTAKQNLFIEAYLETLNATESARRAGYKGSYETLRSIGSQNLTKLNIKARLEERLEAAAMSANEVLHRLTYQAKGADVTDYVTLRDTYAIDDNGSSVFTGFTLDIDLEEIRRRGLGHLIKRISQNSSGGIVVEFYDSQGALQLLGRYYKLFTDKLEHELPEDVTKIIIGG